MTPEAVRLVIWDLDETFWKGTLTEGGIQFSCEHRNIVIELARRGIMSSICSKNDLEPVRAILTEHDVWDYFIFSSINWEPKGQRLAALIQAVQLRPESVLFIDDNPMNLGEARHYVPQLQVADETVITSLLSDPRFVGKADPDLKRLAQYKVLESKKADELASAGDNRAFLRSSNIRVTINYDVENNIDRAIELINRTNQLNFTKKRLPEDLTEARAELRAMISRYDVNAGLVRVQDRYGDYGDVGFFLMTGHRARSFLTHFCFSCRTLNMGIETWVYRWLGKPYLNVVGNVLNNVLTDESPVEEWVQLSDAHETSTHTEKPVKRIVMRGGCDLGALSHYLTNFAETIDMEFPTTRDGRQVRSDQTVFLETAFNEVAHEVKEALENIGHTPSDWDSALRRRDSNSVWLLSFWTDSFAMLYKHKTLDFKVSYLLAKDPHALVDVTQLDEEYAARFIENETQAKHYQYLKEHFQAIGKADEVTVRSAMQLLVQNAPENSAIFVLLGPEHWTKPDGSVVERQDEKRLNSWIRAELEGKPNVDLVSILDFVEPGKAREEALHFDRLTYKRAADYIIRRISVQRATLTT